MEEAIIKKRKFKIERICEKESIHSIDSYLKKKEGIIFVELDSRKKILRLTYDLRKTKFEMIEKNLDKLGLVLSRELIERFKRGLVKFTEQNELDHLNAPVSSCCDDPKSNGQDCNSCMSR